MHFTQVYTCTVLTPLNRVNMSGLVKSEGWFYDDLDNVKIGFKVDEVLFRGKSPLQDILVFQNAEFGRVLVIDGTIQLTEKDECAYHEMIAHLPLNSHPEPKRVLILGGGDGGVAREVVKNSTVETVDICEIDQMVLDVSRKYLPFTSCGLDHPKVTVHVQDGAEFIKAVQHKYDVIITDSSDFTEEPSPSTALFQLQYYQGVKEALAADGIMCSQAMGMWTDEDHTRMIFQACASVFNSVEYAHTYVPSSLGGCNGFVLCTDTQDKSFSNPLVLWSPEEEYQINCQYYTPAIHRAAFTLPRRFLRTLSIGQTSSPSSLSSSSGGSSPGVVR